MKSSISYTLLAAAMACGLVQGQTTAYTTPVGYTTQAIPAGVFSFLGLTVNSSVVSAGTLTAESSTFVTAGTVTPATTVDFVALLGVPAPPLTYILELADGTMQEITNWSSDGKLFTPEDITAKVVPGTTTYKLRKASTISDVFGAANSAGLTSTSGEVSLADQIFLVGPGTTTVVYFFDDGSPDTGWYTEGGAPASNLPIVYTDGFYIRRVAGAPKSLVTSGEVKLKPSSGMLAPGWNFLSSVAPVGLTLGNSGLENFISKTSGGFDTVDNVYIPSGGSFIIAYYFDDGSPDTGWYTDGGTPAASTPLDGGFLIFSRDVATKPYTLNVPASFNNL